MAERLIYLLVGAIVSILVIWLFFWPSFDEKSETIITTETKIDWIKKDTTIYHFKDSLRIREVEIKREPSPEPEKYDSIRTYQGTERFLYGSLNWTAKTGGYLNEISFNPIFDIPITTVTNTFEKTNTKVIHPKGIFITGGINSHFQYSIGATYLNRKSMIGYEYQPTTDVHAAKVGFKVF